MLVALVLICPLFVPSEIANCAWSKATAAIRLPGEFATPVACLLHGHAFLAERSLGAHLSETEQVKVVCAPKGSIAAAIQRFAVVLDMR
jgi:hypothetical protein